MQNSAISFALPLDSACYYNILNQLMVDFHTFSAIYLLLGPWLDFDVEVNRPQVEPAILFKLVARVGHLEIHVLQ